MPVVMLLFLKYIKNKVMWKQENKHKKDYNNI